MSLDAVCQRCGGEYGNWQITEARFDVGKLDGWKMKLCRDCTKAIEAALLKVLKPPKGEQA